MNDLTVFENAQFGQVRTVAREGEPWFVAADVCRALEIEPTATRRLDEDEKNTLRLTQGTSGNPNLTIVSEAGLYSLVLGSRKQEARAFKRWITHEVIPSIRRNGAYATEDTIDRILGDPDFGIRLLGELKQEREARRALEAQRDRDAPKVLFANAVECSDSTILVGEMAKILKQNGMPIGQNRFFEMLRRDGFLIARKGTDYNMPTQRSMEQGLMRIKETSITHADGHVTVSKTPKITGKGQAYFANRYRPKPEDGGTANA